MTDLRCMLHPSWDSSGERGAAGRPVSQQSSSSRGKVRLAGAHALGEGAIGLAQQEGDQPGCRAGGDLDLGSALRPDGGAEDDATQF